MFKLLRKKLAQCHDVDNTKEKFESKESHFEDFNSNINNFDTKHSSYPVIKLATKKQQFIKNTRSIKCELQFQKNTNY